MLRQSGVRFVCWAGACVRFLFRLRPLVLSPSRVAFRRFVWLVVVRQVAAQRWMAPLPAEVRPSELAAESKAFARSVTRQIGRSHLGPSVAGLGGLGRARLVPVRLRSLRLRCGFVCPPLGPSPPPPRVCLSWLVCKLPHRPQQQQKRVGSGRGDGEERSGRRKSVGGVHSVHTPIPTIAPPYIPHASWFHPSHSTPFVSFYLFVPLSGT